MGGRFEEPVDRRARQRGLARHAERQRSAVHPRALLQPSERARRSAFTLRNPRLCLRHHSDRRVSRSRFGPTHLYWLMRGAARRRSALTELAVFRVPASARVSVDRLTTVSVRPSGWRHEATAPGRCKCVDVKRVGCQKGGRVHVQLASVAVNGSASCSWSRGWKDVWALWWRT